MQLPCWLLLLLKKSQAWCINASPRTLFLLLGVQIPTPSAEDNSLIPSGNFITVLFSDIPVVDWKFIVKFTPIKACDRSLHLLMMFIWSLIPFV